MSENVRKPQITGWWFFLTHTVLLSTCYPNSLTSAMHKRYDRYTFTVTLCIWVDVTLPLFSVVHRTRTCRLCRRRTTTQWRRTTLSRYTASRCWFRWTAVTWSRPLPAHWWRSVTECYWPDVNSWRAEIAVSTVVSVVVTNTRCIHVQETSVQYAAREGQDTQDSINQSINQNF